MKKKRIALHTCILSLAIICMLAGMYVCYYFIRDYRYDDVDIYNSEYSYDVISILEYGNANREYRKKFSNENKVLIENKELGNVTVGDIKEIFADKYSEFYTDDSAIDFTDYDDYAEYKYEDEYGNNQRDDTLYDLDVSYRKKYKKEWKQNPTEANREIYLYYKNKCAYVDEYAELVETLMQGIVNDNGLTERFGETSFLLNDTYPVTNSGMVYFTTYTINGDTYGFTNAGSAGFFDNIEENKLEDLTVLKDGKLVQDAPICGDKNIEDHIYNDGQVQFLREADEIYVAINNSDESTHYSSYMKKVKTQPTDKELKAINQNLIICMVVIGATILIAFILYIILMVMAGHKKKGDIPQLNKSDKLWWDVEFVIGFIAFGILYCIPLALEENSYYKWFAITMAIVSLPAIEFVVLISESLMRRLKTRTFMQTTLFGKTCQWIKTLAKKAKACIKKLIENMSLTWKVLVVGAVLFAGQFMTIIMTFSDMEFLAMGFGLIAIAFACYVIWRYFSETRIIEDGARKISEGDIDYKIEETMKFRVNESLKQSVNGIGDGLNDAVAANLKNERMKTELITNVSHDLKTPLTSIINYVDLLKTEGLDSEKADKYLEVLDQKSQRLKQLTEDLVEASKLNSGAIILNREKLDIVQLVNQSLAEYDEKFGSKRLQIVKTVQEEPIWVMADGRKTWRLFDNLYNNVYKYAMEGTRVYLDIRKEAGNVIVSVKNISEQPLNFSADELMERFVRGDVSRTTEGSGLGLSIAKSIAERQGGEMQIVLDGDLFKVEVIMKSEE